MASSQVEVASSVFGCVLRDRNSHDRCNRESTARSVAAAFKRNLKELVRRNGRISFSSDSPISHDEKNSSGSTAPQNDSTDNSSAVSNNHVQDIPPSSSAKPEIPSCNGNLGASSLVQIWEARLNPNDAKANRSPCSMNSDENPASGADNASSCAEDQTPRHSDSDADDVAINEEARPHCKSTAHSAPASVHFRKYDAGREGEKRRITDIIRKLTCEGNEQEQQGTGDTPVSELGALRTLPVAVNAPKIRGRRAFHDLLHQMEQERQREIDSLVGRQTVSRFNHRGRIQSMLRLRVLQRGMGIQDKQRPHSCRSAASQRPRSSQSTASSDSTRSQGSSIMHLRERFNAANEHATGNPSATATSGTSAGKSIMANTTISRSSIHNKKAESHCPKKNYVSHMPEGNHLRKNSTTKHMREGNCLQENSNTQQPCLIQAENSISHTPEPEDSPLQEISTSQKRNPVSRICDDHHLRENSTAQKQDVPQAENSISQIGDTNQKPGEALAQNSLSHFPEGNHLQENSTTGQQSVPLADNSLSYLPQANHLQENYNTQQQSVPLAENSESQLCEANKLNIQETKAGSYHFSWEGSSPDSENLDPQESSETILSLNDWDGVEMEEEYEVADDQQDYYGETMYDWYSDIARPISYWEDRRQAWYQELVTTTSDNDERRKLLERRVVSSFLASDLRDRIDQLMVSRVQMHAIQDDEQPEEDVQEQEVHGRGRGTEEEPPSLDEAESRTSPPHDSTAYFDQSPPSMGSSPPFRRWNYRDYHGYSDDSEHTPITPSQLPLPSQASKLDRRCPSPIIVSSTEINLLNDLKGQMRQLQCEMFELKKSMQSCIEMQVQLQNFFKQKVHPVEENKITTHDRTKKRRSCCVCHEMQVDSFLYRCGHTCTCLECAQELQRSSGKCPICQASILDVVQTYIDA